MNIKEVDRNLEKTYNSLREKARGMIPTCERSGETLPIFDLLQERILQVDYFELSKGPGYSFANSEGERAFVLMCESIQSWFYKIKFAPKFSQCQWEDVDSFLLNFYRFASYWMYRKEIINNLDSDFEGVVVR